MSRQAMTQDNSKLTIAVFAGDGIGPEVTAPCVEILGELTGALGGPALEFEALDAGAAHYQETGEALPQTSLDRAAAADAILLGAMGDPDVRYPDGTEIVPQIDLRDYFELYAGVRPVMTRPGMPVPLADPRGQELDFVIVRESTEGLFAHRGEAEETDDSSTDRLTITRAACERLFDFSFELARTRKTRGGPGIVTCVDKANVLQSFGFFRRLFDERAARHPDIETRHIYADAAALALVKQPWAFDVMVMENLLGDILSDLGAGLMGGLGMAPSADIGPGHAVFQPCHGTAPDIAGSGKANPTAMFLSGAMMLDWLGERHDAPELREGAEIFRSAVDTAFRDGALQPTELGGRDGLAAITERVRAEMRAALAAR
ncbi:MAG: isocitrate/isopropylmalate family dehydrogenase [Alphaproteobacteria bacterium]